MNGINGVTAMLGVLFLAGCGNSPSPVSPSAMAVTLEAHDASPGAASAVAAQAAGSSAAGPQAGGAVEPSPVAEAMGAAIQDEYHAYWTYQGVIVDFGDVRPFVNIVNAEQQHAAALAGLFSRRGLEVPTSGWSLATVPRFESLTNACVAAAGAERANIEMYRSLLALDLPADVRQVFENNQRASLNNHLPAFERCR